MSAMPPEQNHALFAGLLSIYLFNGKVRVAADRMKKARGLKSNVEAVEEVLADMPSADLAKLRGWRKVVQVVRNWLNQAGAKKLAERLDAWMKSGLSDQEKADLFVADLVSAAREWARTGKGGNAGVASMGVTRLAEQKLADDWAAQEKWLQREAKVRGYKSIDDLAEKAYPVFEKLAALWRQKHPADALLSRKTVDYAEARRQFIETEKRLGGRAAYEKAKTVGKTKLDYDQWVMVRTPNFKKWWGYDWENVSEQGNRAVLGETRQGSGAPGRTMVGHGKGAQRSGVAGNADAKVVGGHQDSDGGNEIHHRLGGSVFIHPETGEPRVFYHGTADEFTEFDVDHPNKKDHGWLGRGHYVSSDEEIAATYSRLKRGNFEPRVMSLFVRPINPMELDIEHKKLIRNLSKDQLIEFNKMLTDEGYRGTVVRFFRDEALEIAVFDANSLKSATDNIGTFSESNDIRLSRAVSPAPTSGQRKPAQLTPQDLKQRWIAGADKIINRMDAAVNGLGDMPDQRQYLAQRYRTLGRIAHIDEIAKLIGNAFRAVGLADKKAIYDYLTTRGANPDKISDKNAREWAVKAKSYIGTVGDELVKRGLLPQASRDEYRDRYLPRLYLAHLLDDASWRAIGGGKKASDMGYLKQRNDDLPEEYRKVILGEVTDPAFLAATAVAQPMRDMAILDWLQAISTNKNWVWPNQLIDWNGRLVSAHWLQAESDALLERAALYEDAGDRKKAEALATEMRKRALETMKDMPREHADYRRIPDTPRYGQLRGLMVRREIYDDLVGLGTGVPGDAGFAEQLLGQGGMGSKATQLWKTAKVALNPPGQVRNFISNMVMLQLSGVPLRKIPSLIIRAHKQIHNNGKHWQAAKKYGVTAATFTAQELYRSKRDVLELEAEMNGHHPIIAIKRAANWLMDKAGDAYQWSEALTKTVKMIDAMEREGLSEEQAALEAQKWLFDYSLVDRNIRYLRNAPVGMPFLTYSAKVAPRLLEVATKHPQRFLPWVALFWGMGAAAMAMLGGDGDDWDELKKSLPEWLRKKPHAVPLPWRDSEGRIQFTDIGYFFPWSQWAELGKDLVHGEPMDALRSAGIVGGPVPDIITAIKTGIDPFTKKPIVDPADPTWQQSVAVMNYVWSMAAPPFLTSNGFLSPMGMFDKQYGGKLVQGITGTTDKWGDPRATTEQALIGLAGVNIKGIDPDHTRASELQRLQREALDVKAKLVKRLADRSLSETQRAILMGDYTKEMQERIKKAQEFGNSAKVPAFARPVGGADAR